jgi:hypothetical protein
LRSCVPASGRLEHGMVVYHSLNLVTGKLEHEMVVQYCNPATGKLEHGKMVQYFKCYWEARSGDGGAM